MTGPDRAPGRVLNRSGSIAILVTIILLSLLGAWGLFQDLRPTLAGIGLAWFAVALCSWLLYGALLLLAVRRPIRRAELFTAGALLALAWGGLAATDIAVRANGAVHELAQEGVIAASAPSTVWLVSPAIEETAKTLGIILLAALPAARRFGPAAGFAVGVLVGVSFQVVENVVFTVQAMLEGGGGSLAILLQMGFIRGVVGLFSHVAYSGAIGAAIGWAAAAAPGARARRAMGAVVVWVLMVSLHMFSNWTTTAQAGVLYLASMGLGLLVLIVAYRWVARQPGPVAPAAG
jgi:RsiW-degrading membrane proteinase PrsW (M82 family)